MAKKFIRRPTMVKPIVRRISARIVAETDEAPTARTVGAKRTVRAGGTAVVPREKSPTFGFVNLRLHEVECIKTTKEIDRDEIILATIKVEGKLTSSTGKGQVKAKASQGEQLSVGKFKKGARKDFKSPKVLARFPSGGAHAEWPRYFVAMLMMIEKDEGAIGTIVNSAINSVDKELTAAVSTAVATGATAVLSGVTGGMAIGSAVPLVGTAIGAAAGAAVGLALGEIKKSRADDVIETEHLQLRLERFPGGAGGIPDSRVTKVFRGAKGRYKVTLSWAVS